ncbi:MAG TPA: nuclear transport factor 2 family protein [Acidimicrobiia bacterium]|nr:nuclear transport factor 2 family protein [Acidimicrobiia bacterium]
MTTAIDELLAEWIESERNLDALGLGTLLTDDFVGVGPVGFVLDRDGWLGRFEYGLRYDDLHLDEVTIHEHGDTAVVVAHQHAVGRAGDTPTPPDTRVSFTLVTDENDERKIAAMQYSFIGPPLGTKVD